MELIFFIIFFAIAMTNTKKKVEKQYGDEEKSVFYGKTSSSSLKNKGFTVNTGSFLDRFMTELKQDQTAKNVQDMQWLVKNVKNRLVKQAERDDAEVYQKKEQEARNAAMAEQRERLAQQQRKRTEELRKKQAEQKKRLAKEEEQKKRIAKQEEELRSAKRESTGKEHMDFTRMLEPDDMMQEKERMNVKGKEAAVDTDFRIEDYLDPLTASFYPDVTDYLSPTTADFYPKTDAVDFAFRAASAAEAGFSLHREENVL